VCEQHDGFRDRRPPKDNRKERINAEGRADAAVSARCHRDMDSSYAKCARDELIFRKERQPSRDRPGAGQEGRRGRGGKRDAKRVNVFQSLLVNAVNGVSLSLANHGTAKRPQLALVSYDAVGKNYRSIPYHIFEEAGLRSLREVKVEDVLPVESTPKAADVLRAKLANVRADMAGYEADLREGHSKRLAALLREKEAEEERLAGELQDALAASVRPAERAWSEFPGLVDLIREKGDEARLNLRPVLRSIVDTIRVVLVRRDSWTVCLAQFRFTGGGAQGGTRDLTIMHRQGCRRRPTEWRSRTMASPGPSGIDLADKKQAKEWADNLSKLKIKVIWAFADQEFPRENPSVQHLRHLCGGPDDE
jgi:hypothetical protein